MDAQMLLADFLVGESEIKERAFQAGSGQLCATARARAEIKRLRLIMVPISYLVTLAGCVHRTENEARMSKLSSSQSVPNWTIMWAVA